MLVLAGPTVVWQLDRRLHDAVAGLLSELRSPEHPVRPRFNSTVSFTQLDASDLEVGGG